MKTIASLSKSFLPPTPDPERIFSKIIHNGNEYNITPKPAKDIVCTRCGGNIGFACDKDSWSCGNRECIFINAGPNFHHEIKNLPQQPKPQVVIPKAPEKIDYFADCTQKESDIKKLKDFVAHPRGFFVLAGHNGTGKSYAANCIFNSLDFQLHEKYFINQADLNLLWQDNQAEYKSVNYLVTKIAEYKLLIIDDLGTRKPTEAFMDFLYNVVDKRYKSQLPTVITTNLTGTLVREQFGDAFLSRIASGVNCRFEGKDRRLNEW